MFVSSERIKLAQILPKNKRWAYCYYCDQYSTRIEFDHFPIPQEVGGVETVHACIVCHDLKDRLLLEHWDTQDVIQSLFELIEKKMIIPIPLKQPTTESVAMNAVVNAVSDEWKTSWPTLSRCARILYGKLRRIAEVWKVKGDA